MIGVFQHNHFYFLKIYLPGQSFAPYTDIDGALILLLIAFWHRLGLEKWFFSWKIYVQF